MKPSLSALALIVAAAIVVAIGATLRARDDAPLRAATDSADVRIARLTGEVFAAEAREAVARDSIAALRRTVATWRGMIGAERTKSDSLWKFALHMDSIAVPKPLVVALVGSLHAQIIMADSVIHARDDEIEHWARMYASADSGRAALWTALTFQRELTKKWQAAARPPLFSLRRVRVGPGCAAGVGGMACGLAVSYAF